MFVPSALPAPFTSRHFPLTLVRILKLPVGVPLPASGVPAGGGGGGGVGGGGVGGGVAPLPVIRVPSRHVLCPVPPPGNSNLICALAADRDTSVIFTLPSGSENVPPSGRAASATVLVPGVMS